MHILSVVVTYRLLCPCYCLQLWYDKGNNKPNEHFQVQTTKGRVTGHLANGSHTVLEYLGIPYARPPVGDLRLAPPQRFTGNSDYEAANFGYDCPLTTPPPLGYPDLTPQADRILNSFASGNKTPQSEDCLTLNIWGRRAKSFQRRRKPVLIFFYGGRFTIGNTNSPFYNGKHFAEAEDVLIVTVNYRINIFGFPGAPGLTQNLGLRDQRAAVEWLRDNIEAFGGDRNRMTISGQSSGAVAVDYWSYAYKADPIVKGLILQSGNALSFPLNEAEVQKRNWDTVIQAVNCSSATDAVSCVRAVDWNTLKDAAAQIRPSRSSSVLRSIPAFYPVADEEIVFSDYVDRAKAGSFAKLLSLTVE